MPPSSARTADRPFPRPDPGFLIRCTDDDEFDLLYPRSIRDLSSCHWSPFNVCRLAARLLVTAPGTRVINVTHVREQLSQMPVGTRVVTYCGDHAEIPNDYECERTAFNEQLMLWVRQPPVPTLGGAALSAQPRKEVFRRQMADRSFSNDLSHRSAALI